MLVELSVMERYQAVLAEVQDGWKVVERSASDLPASISSPFHACRHDIIATQA